MNILKISFLFRAPSVGRDYKLANQRDLAGDLTAGIERAVAPVKPVRSSIGSVQHHFYITAETGVEPNRAMAKRVLEEVIEDENLRKMIVIAVIEPSAKDLKELREKVSVEDNPAFWAVVEKEGPAEQPEEPTQPKPAPRSAADVVEKDKDKEGEKAEAEAKVEVESRSETEVEETNRPVNAVQEVLSAKKEKESQPQESQLPVPLSVQAANIRRLKEMLLGKVRGQRHAVDTLLHGIFESEMFASGNDKRKGPLATFLFAGPSGVGKTYLASMIEEALPDRKVLVVDMSEYSDNLANLKFNGEHGQPAIVTGFARKHPNGIIVFDEVEKAHLNTIYLFLQILDGARLMDYQKNREVSFRDNIIVMTTNVGKALYEDSTVCDLSAIPRQVILDGLRKEMKPGTKDEQYFPECIITRMANGRVVMFNHLEPYALLQIIQDELALQLSLFEKSSGVKITYDPKTLAALVLYHGGGIADARSLRSLARDIVVRELQEVAMQLLEIGPERVDSLKEISLTINTQESEEVGDLFFNHNRMQVPVLTEGLTTNLLALGADLQTDFDVLADEDEFKRRVRGVADYVLIDPLCGNEETDHIPNDVDDLNSVGMRMLEYTREYMPEIPVYILDTTGKIRSFDSLLSRGARGVVRVCDDSAENLKKTMEELAFCALVNNVTFSLGRSHKFLNFNCAQYLIDESCAVVSFEKLGIKSAPQAEDGNQITKRGENTNLKFDDVVGCRAAKEVLADYCTMLEDPRKIAMKGRKMPKGVLLYGPPGTGKTMLAKAMANECGATFFQTTASSFFAPLQGQTEENIRETFRRARKYAPSIIFVDEVDAIARMRTGVGNTNNEDALNAFLAEMDGFVTDERRPVFILAATNYQLEGEGGMVLDPAFVRRFDQKILIDLPDTDDRYTLLRKSLEKHGIHFGEDHEKILQNMAKRTGGMNNADLEMINANYARALGSGEPNGVAYMESLDAYRFGEVNKMDPQHLRQTACHEAGHALVCRLCGTTPSFLTVVSRGSYGGFMESAGEKDKGTHTYRELMDRVCRCLAGRAAEIEVYGNTSGTNTGASSDIKSARYYMRSALNEYAMGEKFYAPWTDEEIENRMREEYRRTCDMVREHRNVLDALTDRLLQQKSMDQTQLEEFFTSMGI